MKVKFSKKFVKQYKACDLKIQKVIDAKLLIFTKSPMDPVLNNHSLRGSLLGLHSINVTGDWRALYSILDTNGEKVAYFELVGTHSQLYG